MGRLYASCIVTALILAAPLAADDGARALEVLANNCLGCHEGAKAKAGLDLSQVATVLRGSDTGPVVAPGKADASSLVALTQPGAKPHMPPKGQLDAEEIGALKKWINALPAGTVVGRQISDADRDHWAFRPVRRPEVPRVKNAAWVQTPIDAFILARLEARGITPSEPAARRDLIRRATFDLIGLPPTPEEVDAFVKDASPKAYEQLLDRLLASPHYGERWGRHWLDVARYAESNGIGEDGMRPTAWRYRDYVIKAFNDDKPFAQFVREQIAGDEISPPSVDALVATGFCRHAPTVDQIRAQDAEKYRLEELDDVISTASQAFLGLTIGCARCHDHKTDPLPQADYYRMLAVFNSSTRFSPSVEDLAAKPKSAADGIMAITDGGSKMRETRLLIRGNLKTPGDKVAPGIPLVLTACAFPAVKPTAKTTGLRTAFAEWLTAKDHPLTYRVAVNRIWQYHFGRGIVPTSNNFGKSGDPPSHPELLDWLTSEFLAGGGRMKALHKLIMTSAVYQQSSAMNAAAHKLDPENLDLWRMPKRRLESEPTRDAMLAVAGTLNPKMGGPSFQPKAGAALLPKGKAPAEGAAAPAEFRRSVYLFVRRSTPVPMMELLDSPPSSHSCERRTESIVATQSLMFLNGDFVNAQSRWFAQRVAAEAGPSVEAQITLAFRLAFQRLPDADELQQSQRFLAEQTARRREAGGRDAASALADLCHALLASNEFIFLN